MASSACRLRGSWFSSVLVVIGASGGCATTAPPSPAAPTTASAPVTAYEAGVELPEGRAREILVAACLDCHGLTALPLFKAFYTRDDWHTLLVTMQGHGAKVDDAEIEVLADYLAQHFSSAPAAAAAVQPN